MTFDRNILECSDAISVHDYLAKNTGFKAEFNLRFVWIAGISALDHYITELVIEKATEAFVNAAPLQSKLDTEVVTIGRCLSLRYANSVEAVLQFRKLIATGVRFRSFHRASQVADALAYIWGEKHKWQRIASEIGTNAESAKSTLDAIVDRRNLIAHNADIDESSGMRLPVNAQDARRVVTSISNIVEAIDRLVP